MLDIEFGVAVNDGMRDMGVQVYSEDSNIAANFRVPVPASDSISEMEKEASLKLRSFLEQVLKDL